MRSPETGMDLKRPTLTKQQVASLGIGDQIRDIPGHPYDVIGFVESRYGRVAVLEFWSPRRESYRYLAVTALDLSILYTPA